MGQFDDEIRQSMEQAAPRKSPRPGTRQPQALPRQSKGSWVDVETTPTPSQSKGSWVDEEAINAWMREVETTPTPRQMSFISLKAKEYPEAYKAFRSIIKGPENIPTASSMPSFIQWFMDGAEVTPSDPAWSQNSTPSSPTPSEKW